jgi:Transposase DDE domain group 1
METIAKGERGGKGFGGGERRVAGKARKIGASTRYDFGGGRLTPYGGLLPLAALWEKLGLWALVGRGLTVKRQPESLSNGQFVLSTVLLFFLGFTRYHHVQYVREDELVQGVMGGGGPLPVQSTFWRFLDSLEPHNEGQLMKINQEMSRRVWEAGKVKLRRIHLDTDSTMNPAYGDQMGARKGYNLRRRGGKGLRPLLSFVAETGECVRGKQHNGSSASGPEMAAHITAAMASLDARVEEVVGRMDAGFYAKEVVEAIEALGERYSYIVVAQKTSALVRALEAADWKKWAGSGGVSEFEYQPEGWNQPHRFVAVRYAVEPEASDQYPLFSTEGWKYRVFVTNRGEDKRTICCEYDGRATAENYIKEGCNDAGFGVLSGQNFKANQNYLQMAILAYNSNRWLQLMALGEQESYQRRQLRTERLRLVFVAAKLVVHEGRSWVRFSQSYGEQDRFHRLMERLRSIKQQGGTYTSSRAAPLTARVFS